MPAFHSFQSAQFKPQLSASKNKCAGGLQSFRARHPHREVEAYSRFANLLKFFSEIPVLDYTDAVAARFEDLKVSRLRVGSMDLKIAAIALSQEGLLLSANLKDFQKVPNLRVEDWTQ